MKKYANYIIVGVIALIVGIGFYMNNVSSSTFEGASLTIPGNIVSPLGRKVNLAIKVPEGIQSVEIVFNGKSFKKIANPKNAITFSLMTDYYGLGNYILVIKSVLEDGSVIDDAHEVAVVSDIAPEILTPQIIAEHPHNPEYYTQGYEFDGDQLYESTGQYGESKLGKINFTTGTMTSEVGLDQTKFGEGITILGDLVYQLTWKEGQCFTYNKNTLVMGKELPYKTEGWGLCNDGTNIIMSDGSEVIYFRDPKSFDIVRQINVADNQGAIQALNELEYIDGKIYANVWQTSDIVVIDPKTGKVLQRINCEELVRKGQNGGDVLNGIAYNKNSKKLYFTGKKWTKTFEVSLKPKAIS